MRMIVVLLLVMVSAGSSFAADKWPTRPIRVVVTFGAGGTSDIAARVMAEALSTRLGQPMIIENRAGVAGILGTEFAAKATPDGHTLLLTSVGPMAFAPSVPRKLDYHPLRDFQHIGMIGTVPLILVTNTGFAPASLDEVIAVAKGKPGVLNFGSSGTASPSHLMLERFNRRFNLDIAHIPFKNGSPATLAEIVGGRIEGAWDTLPAMLTMVRAKKVRSLAVTSAQRHPLLPDVPAVVELGYPDMVATSWFGLAAPAGTPKGIVQRLNAEMTAALNTPEVRAKLAELSFTTAVYSADEMQKFVANEVQRWRPVVTAAKITF
jgi:tripartite-type tricarboxylate transporter receptor subunit TctC